MVAFLSSNPALLPGYLHLYQYLNDYHAARNVDLAEQSDDSLGSVTMQAEMATNYGLIMAGAALAAVPP